MSRWSVFMMVVALVVVQCSADNALSKFFSGVGTAGCVITITPKLTSDCLTAFDDEVGNRPKDESDKKTACCAYLRLESCVLKISEKECGDEAKSAANTFLNNIGRGIAGDDCVDYGFITCITLFQWLIAGAVGLGALFLLSCICFCCCRR